MLKLVLTLFVFFLMQQGAIAAEKGLLPELQISKDNEDENQLKAMKTEILITKAENEAIASLKRIIKKRAGRPDEPHLWYRLGELYMRRAKSGRFFDLFRQTDKAVQFVAPAIREQSAAGHLKEAIKIYAKIEKTWPKFEDLDSVLFNSAFALQQINEQKKAEVQYKKIIAHFPQSQLIPDARLALGEMIYQAARFDEALAHFEAIEKYPNSRVYAYGIYKAAWTLYNLRKNEEAIDRLIRVVKYFDPGVQRTVKVNHNLRREALHDLGLFFGEVNSADQAFAFFSKLCHNYDELSDSLLHLARLYESHSRFKEMNTFLSHFIDKYPDAKDRIKAQMMIAQAYETLRERKSVVEQLENMAKVCLPDSSFRKANLKESTESCDFDFPKLNIELAKKWWELWQKNRKNKDIAGYTLRAFEIHLTREDPKKPDTKSRYAYAELLFQLENYRQASVQYELVSDKSLDTTIQHDSSYSTIVALEKARELDKQDKDPMEVIRLAKKYLERHKNGQHAITLTFKVGFIHFELKQLEESEKWLKPLALDKKSGEFKRKSEDLVLEIYNQKKDYKNIHQFASQLIAEKPKEQDRVTQLVKIMEEAKFADIQLLVAQDKKEEASGQLYAFAKDHASSPLAKEAFWQSLSLSFALGKSVDGADQSLEFIKLYPDDKRVPEALKETAKRYADSGLLLPAADTLMQLSEKLSGQEKEAALEAAAEFYLLEGKQTKARQVFSKLMKADDKKHNTKIYQQIIATYQGKEDSPEYKQLEEILVKENIEPYASKVQLRKVEAAFAKKDYSQAFQAARSIVGGEGDPETRAMARLIQAQVLEKELVQQSTKTSVERLAVVLGLKTEKLDKAQTAYLSAGKLSALIDVQLASLSGLSRCYQNYIDTVGNPSVKTELNSEEKTALETELQNLIRPIIEKKKEIDEKVAQLNKMKSEAQQRMPANTQVQNNKSSLALFLPEKFTVSKNEKFEKWEPSKWHKCQLVEEDKKQSINELSEKFSKCILLKNYKSALQYADLITRKAPHSSMALYYRSILATELNEIPKAKYLLDVALKKDSEHPVLVYHKGLLHLISGETKQAEEWFAKAKDLKLPIKDEEKKNTGGST